MDEVEDRLQLGADLKRGPTALFLPHHPTSGSCQSLDLSIEVLIDGRCSGVADSGARSVHFEYAYGDMYSVYQNRLKMNKYSTAISVMCAAAQGILIMTDLKATQSKNFAPAVSVPATSRTAH